MLAAQAANAIEKVKLWTVRRQVSTGSWLDDRIALRKTLFLCSGCQHKMGWRWQRRYKYREMTSYHGDGHCDGCRNEDSGAMFLHESDYFWHFNDVLKPAFSDVVTRERIAVTDKRRIYPVKG